MNRQQRRKAAKENRNANAWHAPTIAIHEAGHAVARYLTAEEMGFETEEAIAYIEIAFVPLPYGSLDGKAMLSSSAVTFGMMYSRPMSNYLQSNPVLQDMDPGHPVAIQAGVAACRNAGIDVEGWAKAKAFICMAAVAAEAKFTSRPLDEVTSSYECENDHADALRDCRLAGMTIEEATSICNNALCLAETVFSDPRHWRAVVALAESLPSAGRLQGRRAAAIIARALSVSQRVVPGNRL